MFKRKIYTVTGVRRSGDDARCFGWFSTMRAAKKSLVTAAECVCEDGYYYWMVIEAIGPGIHARVKAEIWYVWNGVLGTWDRCEKPVSSIGITNFNGIG